MNNINKTTLFTLIISSISILASYLVQLRASKNVNLCSYLDPLIVDVLAFLAATFLIVEGVSRIYLNRSHPLKQQLTRSIRIAFGCAILTLHIMQFLHKV